MADGKTAKLIGGLMAAGGGAGAAYLDSKFATTTLAGQGPGTLAALGLLAVGVVKGGKIGHGALGLAAGAIGFEAGKMMVGRMSAPAVSGVRGHRMGAVRGTSLPGRQHRPISAEEFDAHLRAVSKVA